MINTKPQSNRTDLVLLGLALFITVISLIYTAIQYTKAFPTVTVITENK